VGRPAPDVLPGLRDVELPLHAILLHYARLYDSGARSSLQNGPISRVIEVTFPDSVPTHCRVQKFYYDDNFMLRRMDYTTDVAKRVASHYCWDHKEFGGIVSSTLRRVVRRDPETDRPVLEGPTSFSLYYCSMDVR
jgi:hypothetical protein